MIDPHVTDLLNDILLQMQMILGNKLVGLYLFGSLVTGDFDPVSSDVDLLAALASDLDEIEFNGLKRMHADLALKYPAWEGRIEIAYASLHALKTFKTQSYQLGIISPGEPFHIVDADKGWLMNWYTTREKGKPLFGPPVQTIIDSISNDEYVRAVRNSIAAWRTYDLYSETVSHRSAQAYAILTMCRGFYTHRHGESVSKRQVAEWAQKELPEWAALIQNALVWRKQWRDEGIDHAATLDETRRFVRFVIDKVARESA
jgi:hypothetical protein